MFPETQLNKYLIVRNLAYLIAEGVSHRLFTLLRLAPTFDLTFVLSNQRRVQQRECSRALVVLVPIFTPNV